MAVLMVMGAHFPFIAGDPVSHLLWSADQAFRGGYIGVDLFFVLSGFLITRILLCERMRDGGISLKAFYARRALRIFPIYYASILFCVVVFQVRGLELGSLLLYGFNYFQPLHPGSHPMEHTWSLAVEEQFYLIWPVLLAVVPPRWGRVVTGLVVPSLALGAALLFALLLDPTLAASLITMSAPTRMLSLSLGATLAVRERQERALPLAWCVAAGAAGVCLLAADQAARAAGLTGGGCYWLVATLGYALVSTGVIATLVFGRGALVRGARAVLQCPPLRWIGRISYGLYLYHLIVLFCFGLNPYARHGVDSAPVGPVLAAGAVALAVAVASYYGLERPLLRLKPALRTRSDDFAGIHTGRRFQA